MYIDGTVLERAHLWLFSIAGLTLSFPVSSSFPFSYFLLSLSLSLPPPLSRPWLSVGTDCVISGQMDQMKKLDQVVHCICILNHTIPNIKGLQRGREETGSESTFRYFLLNWWGLLCMLYLCFTFSLCFTHSLPHCVQSTSHVYTMLPARGSYYNTTLPWWAPLQPRGGTEVWALTTRTLSKGGGRRQEIVLICTSVGQRAGTEGAW